MNWGFSMERFMDFLLAVIAVVTLIIVFLIALDFIYESVKKAVARKTFYETKERIIDEVLKSKIDGTTLSQKALIFECIKDITFMEIIDK